MLLRHGCRQSIKSLIRDNSVRNDCHFLIFRAVLDCFNMR